MTKKVGDQDNKTILVQSLTCSFADDSRKSIDESSNVICSGGNLCINMCSVASFCSLANDGSYLSNIDIK